MASVTYNGPVPSKLTLLSDLRQFTPGQKVRFLGCVTEYSTKTACLILEHNHPPGNHLKAFVDVRLLLRTLKSNDTQIGEWVNIIGYVTVDPANKQTKKKLSDVNIQALVLWSTNPLKLQAYEKSLDLQKPDDKPMQASG